jgi:molybdopterin converting factor small subunit
VTVTVRLFALYADKFGRSTLDLDLPEGALVRDALAIIATLPGASALPPAPLVAVNRTYARGETHLSDGDELAIIPPVAGG